MILELYLDGGYLVLLLNQLPVQQWGSVQDMTFKNVASRYFVKETEGTYIGIEQMLCR